MENRYYKSSTKEYSKKKSPAGGAGRQDKEDE